MATIQLVRERYYEGDAALKIYVTHGFGWGSSVIDLKGSPYGEAARDYVILADLEVSEDEIPEWEGTVDGAELVKKFKPQLQSLVDLHFRGTSSRLTL